MAQVRDVIKGWAGEVIGETLERVVGTVVLFGKSMGDTNGLAELVWFKNKEREHTDSRDELFGRDYPQRRRLKAKEDPRDSLSADVVHIRVNI